LVLRHSFKEKTMKQMLLLFVVLVALAGCAPAPTQTPALPVAQDTPTSVAVSPPAGMDILGDWVVVDGVRNGTYYSVPVWVARAGSPVEIARDHIIVQDVGTSYRWLDSERIAVGLFAGAGSVNDAAFYVYTVRMEGDALLFVTRDGTVELRLERQ
jgi:hypothetical protein